MTSRRAVPSATPRDRAPPPPTARFRHADRYRVDREWMRYEGTAQRDEFRQLRERFLERHAGAGARSVDLGSGPGRFTPFLGSPPVRPVALDLSKVALEVLGERWPSGLPRADRVRGDALRPPFPPATFDLVAVLGNTLGFAESEGERLMRSAESLVAPRGRLLLEIAPGPGERSNYLARLPASSIVRLLHSPVGLLVRRVANEGFRSEPSRKARPGTFHRFGARSVTERLAGEGWSVRETLAVAPALGPAIDRLERIRPDVRAWEHLLSVEEELGRAPERWSSAAALLIAAERVASAHTIN